MIVKLYKKITFMLTFNNNYIYEYNIKYYGEIMLFGSEILKAKKKMYAEQYHIRRTLSNVWQFVDKETFQVKNELTFDSMPDKFHDKIRKKIVDSHNSAFVLLILDKMYKTNSIDLTGWRIKQCKINKTGNKCITKILAIPISNIMTPEYTRKYVFDHQDEFKIVVKCKIYNISAPEYYTYQYIDTNEINEMSVTKKNKYIRALLSKGIPDKILRKYLKISQMQLWRIKNSKV